MFIGGAEGFELPGGSVGDGKDTKAVGFELLVGLTKTIVRGGVYRDETALRFERRANLQHPVRGTLGDDAAVLLLGDHHRQAPPLEVERDLVAFHIARRANVARENGRIQRTADAGFKAAIQARPFERLLEAWPRGSTAALMVITPVVNVPVLSQHRMSMLPRF